MGNPSELHTPATEAKVPVQTSSQRTRPPNLRRMAFREHPEEILYEAASSQCSIEEDPRSTMISALHLNEEEAHVGSAALKTKRFDFSGKVVEVLRSQYSPPASMRFDFRAHFTPSSSINLLPLPPCTPSRSPAKTSPPEEPHTTVGMLADQAQSVQAQKTNARQQQQQQQEREEGGEYKVETEHAEWVAQDLKITEMEGREKEATGERWERDASGREEMMEKQKEDTRKEREKKEREMEDTQNEERRQKEHVSASEVDTLVVGKQEEGVGHESCGTLPTCELLPPPRPADADKECVQGDASAGSKSLGQKRRFDWCTMEGDERDSKKSKDSDNEVSEKEGDTQDEGACYGTSCPQYS